MRSSCLRRAHSEPISLIPPRIAFVLHRLNAGMQVAGVDGGLHQHVLGGGELLAQFGVLGRQGDEKGSQVVARPRSTSP